ncbi:ABC transporter permease [Bradyrhizobium diazoefficiens]|nr:ABC transporter permease [Bradyrhizobium diazoefficiens]MBR0851611.1 ABC transporter permease [Bradyrhizobium diazoefficiens]
MRPLDVLRSALEGLGRNLLRSLLTALGVIIGTAAVIATIAVGAAARERLLDQIRTLGSNLIIVTPGAANSGGARVGDGHKLTVDDASAMEGEIAAIEAAAPVVHGRVQVVAEGGNASMVVLGTNRGFFVAREWGIANGRGLMPDEIDSAAKVAVIGRTVAERLFGDADPVGQTMRVQSVPLRVVGVLERKGQDALGADQDDLVVVPLWTAKNRILGVRGATSRSIAFVFAKMRRGESMAETEQQIGDLLRQRHHASADRGDDFSIRNMADIMQRQDASARILTLLLAAVAGVSLLVGGIGIMNVMLVSVTERTREIGLRLAVGARRRDIVLQFLIEAATISGIGGGIGAALGVAAALVLAGVAGWPTIIEPQSVLLASVFSLVIGIVFGFYPARRAAALQPAIALRHE